MAYHLCIRYNWKSSVYSGNSQKHFSNILWCFCLRFPLSEIMWYFLDIIMSLLSFSSKKYDFQNKNQIKSSYQIHRQKYLHLALHTSYCIFLCVCAGWKNKLHSSAIMLPLKNCTFKVGFTSHKKGLNSRVEFSPRLKNENLSTYSVIHSKPEPRVKGLTFCWTWNPFHRELNLRKWEG